MMNEADIEKAKIFLINNLKPYLIYLFGSSCTNNFRDDSDIDIAYLSDNESSDYEIFMLSQELADLLRRDVDLIDLKKASTVFKAQVLGGGKVIFCNDANRRMYFEMRSLKEYALLNEERKMVLESIKQRGTIYGK